MKRFAGDRTCIVRDPIRHDGVTVPGSDPAARFSTLFATHSRPLLAYALRRVERSEDAADVVAETMLVAWRRLDDVPGGDQTRPWLFGVARRVLSNHHRSMRRGARLGERLRESLADAAIIDHAEAVGTRATVFAALHRLGDEDREILCLTAWEGLGPVEIAAALSIPPETVRTRLHRARGRLRRELEAGGWRSEAAAHIGPTEHQQREVSLLARQAKGEA
jgi:RNA polymerase sigma-70 factor, ECF subfamily